MSSLLSIVKKRVNGKGGDPVIQLQTPFGGGKTHSLIAMFHRAKEWNTKRVVIVGEKLNTGSTAEEFETFWGMMEKQLTGNITEFNSPIPPGGEQIRKVLVKNSPVLILMDELIPYLNSADGVNVGKQPCVLFRLNSYRILQMLSVQSKMSLGSHYNSEQSLQ